MPLSLGKGPWNTSAFLLLQPLSCLSCLLPASKRALGITRGERRAPRYDEARARSNNTHHILSTAPDRIVANGPRSTAPQNNGPLLPCSSVVPPERVPIRRHHRRPFTFTPSRGRMAQSSLGRPCLRSRLRSCLLRLCLRPCLRWLATHLHVQAQSDAVESVGWRFAATAAGSVFRACVVCPRVSRARSRASASGRVGGHGRRDEAVSEDVGVAFRRARRVVADHLVCSVFGVWFRRSSRHTRYRAGGGGVRSHHVRAADRYISEAEAGGRNG